MEKTSSLNENNEMNHNIIKSKIENDINNPIENSNNDLNKNINNNIKENKVIQNNNNINNSFKKNINRVSLYIIDNVVIEIIGEKKN